MLAPQDVAHIVPLNFGAISVPFIFTPTESVFAFLGAVAEAPRK
jgi:hypothetical protein